MAKPGLGEEEEIQFMINGVVQEVNCFILDGSSIEVDIGYRNL